MENKEVEENVRVKLIIHNNLINHNHEMNEKNPLIVDIVKNVTFNVDTEKFDKDNFMAFIHRSFSEEESDGLITIKKDIWWESLENALIINAIIELEVKNLYEEDILVFHAQFNESCKNYQILTDLIKNISDECSKHIFTFDSDMDTDQCVHMLLCARNEKEYHFFIEYNTPKKWKTHLIKTLYHDLHQIKERRIRTFEVPKYAIDILRKELYEKSK